MPLIFIPASFFMINLTSAVELFSEAPQVRESFHTAFMLWDGAFGFEYEFDSSNSNSGKLYLPKGVKLKQNWELHQQVSQL